MPLKDKEEIFDFMNGRIRDTANQNFVDDATAFGRWFANLFFTSPRDFFVSDGSKDGQIDAFFSTDNGSAVTHHVLNTKYTAEFNKLAPPAFYHEAKYFWQAFENKSARPPYLEKAVKGELRPKYRQLFERYDAGGVELMFVTNHRCNEAHFEQVRNIPVKFYHLDDLVQCVVDDIDGAMPRTPAIQLRGIQSLLPANQEDTEVATSIVFARLLDFITYMERDPHDLLFNRNVRVAMSVSQSGVNRAIRDTFKESPREFAFSNNGITLLCDKQQYDPGQKVLALDNPRVVNGSQTLHSIRDVQNPSPNARVMVRIIEIEPPKGSHLEEKTAKRKEIIGKIAIRSNQQNPIKNWDLASNDEFQMELFRFFRKKGYFYERRKREWAQRSRELKSVGIWQGPDIRRLTQLISSYHWSNARLGPVLAKNVSELFAGAAYDQIRRTPPELAYQLFLLDSYIWKCRAALAKERQYIRNLKRYEYFVLFSLAVRALAEANAKWKSPIFTSYLERDDPGYYSKKFKTWCQFVKSCIDHILSGYKIEAQDYKRREGRELTYANYFKSQTSADKAVKEKVPDGIKNLSHFVLSE